MASGPARAGAGSRRATLAHESPIALPTIRTGSWRSPAIRRFAPLGRAKSSSRALAGLAGSGENRYISRNLWFSYDRVLRVGPPGPALFYYLNGSRNLRRRARFRATAGPPNPTQV